jgi:L-ascorbate metabolism protein UlaG (beta-lactamase superfamily)
MEKVYLKPNVLVEPLYNQWYAWSGLIYPATAALYIVNSHLRIMESFIAAPQIHVNALKNPAMIGGPFISHEVDKVGEIKALMEKTIREQPHMLKLAEAIRELDTTLSNEADGHSMQPFYRKVPDLLKGYVELVYDLHHHPQMRFIEGLLYKSHYYNAEAQTLAFSIIEKDERPFVISTPRLESDGFLHLQIPFNDPVLDDLFKMKQTPRPLAEIKELMDVNGNGERFSSFFTEEPQPQGSEYTGDDVRVRHFGHACVMVQTNKVSIFVDPLISYEIDSPIKRYTYADLPEIIDYVLITHAHQDHCMFETLLQLRHKIRNLIVPKSNSGALADPSLKLILQHMGFENVREIDEMETIRVEDGGITGLPFLGEHADLNVRSKGAYFIKLKGRSVVCAADSDNIESKMYEHIHEFTKRVDIVFQGLECEGAPLSWLYGSLYSKPLPRKLDQSRRLNSSNYEKAISIVDELKPAQVYVYAMGLEPWLPFVTTKQYTDDSRPIIDANRLVAECKRRGIVSEILYGHKELFLSPVSDHAVMRYKPVRKAHSL